MNAPKEINVESLEGWTKEYNDQEKFGDCLKRMPDDMLDEWLAVMEGRTVLKTPDGRKWWVPISGSLGEMRISGDVAETLVDYVIDHMMAAEHTNISMPALFFDKKTLDPSYVFCFDCMRFVDAAEDARIYDGLENRGWDD